MSVDSSVKILNIVFFNFCPKSYFSVSPMTFFAIEVSFVLFKFILSAIFESGNADFMVSVKWPSAFNDILCLTKKPVYFISALFEATSKDEVGWHAGFINLEIFCTVLSKGFSLFSCFVDLRWASKTDRSAVTVSKHSLHLALCWSFVSFSNQYFNLSSDNH